MSIQRFFVRTLTTSDTAIFRDIRLQALKTEGELFGPTFETELTLPYSEWEKRVAPTEDAQCFGLFDRRHLFARGQLIGVMCVMPWDEDTSGTTALWGRAYLKREYRGKGLARPLYMAREIWTAKHPRYTSAVMFIKEGNHRSEEIHTKHGATLIFSRKMEWPGRESSLWNWYRVDLKGYAKALTILADCFPEIPVTGIAAANRRLAHLKTAEQI